MSRPLFWVIMAVLAVLVVVGLTAWFTAGTPY